MTAPAMAREQCPVGMVASENTCCDVGEEYVPSQHVCAPYRPERHCVEGRLDSCVEAGRNLEVRGATGAGYAAELYRFACEQGAAAGCTGLALLYESGNGIERDHVRSEGLLQIACDRGHLTACTMRAEELHARGDASATEMFAQACHRGDATACARYADCLTAGGQISELAGAYYRRACDDGVGAACRAVLEAERQVGAPLAARERGLLESACRGQDAEGCSLLGDAFMQGLIAPQSSARAASHYRLACERGHVEACARLAALVEEGDGVMRDEARASELYAMACDAGVAKACERFSTLETERLQRRARDHDRTRR